jgi:hypothetical protein
MQSKYIFAAVGLVAAGVVVFLLSSQPASVPAIPPSQAASSETPSSVPEIQPPPETPAQASDVPTPSPVAPVRRQAGPIRQTDEDGVVWSVDLAGGGRRGEQAGPPVIVKTDVYTSGRDVSIGLVLEGQAGERLQPVVTKNGYRMPAPKLRIVNEAGQVLVDDSFRYG